MKRSLLYIILLLLTLAVFAQPKPSKTGYVVIGKYPFSPFKIGDTIRINEQNKSVTFYSIDSVTKWQGSQIRFYDYPNIFRPLTKQ